MATNPDQRYTLSVNKKPTYQDVISNPDLVKKLGDYGANINRYIYNNDGTAVNKNASFDGEAQSWQQKGVQDAIDYVFGSKVLGNTQQKLLGGDYDQYLPNAQKFATDWGDYVSGSDMGLAQAQSISPIASNNQPVPTINPNQAEIKPGEPGYMAPNFVGNPAGNASQPTPLNPSQTPNVSGEQTSSQAQGGNTIDEVQASPIPPLPQGYGQGSGMSPVDWALQHRQNIYQAYQEYGITPSIDEVNFQLQNNPNIDSIKASIREAVASGQDTRGTMPVTESQSIAETKASDVISGVTSQGSISDVVKQISEAMGLTDITNAINDIDVKEGEEIMAINDNPWLSEAERSKRVSLTQSKYESRKTALVDKLKLQSDVVSKAVDYYQKQRDYEKDVLKMQLDEKNKELDRQKIDTKTVTANGRELLINSQTGETIKDLGGAYKASSGGSGSGSSNVAANSKFWTVTASAKNELQQGEPWRSVWNRVKAQFPNVKDADIDNALGGGTYFEGPTGKTVSWGWAKPGAYQEFKNQNGGSTDDLINKIAGL